MLAQRLLMLMPMLALLTMAAIIDLRSRRIPNWLTLSLAATGLLQSCLPASELSPAWSFLGLLAGLALNLPLWMLKIRGGGDVKLFAGLGAWIGPQWTFEVFVVSTIVAAVMAILQAVAGGKLMPLLRNTGVLAVNLAHSRTQGLANVTRGDGSFRTVGKHVPYAVPVIIATLIVLAMHS